MLLLFINHRTEGTGRVNVCIMKNGFIIVGFIAGVIILIPIAYIIGLALESLAAIFVIGCIVYTVIQELSDHFSNNQR